jgi:SAM-dependent methyltransferase
MEDIKCIFCDTHSDHVLIKENGYNGRKCAGCGLIYVSPRPSIAEIKDLYGHDLANISAESHIRDEFAKRLYAKNNLELIRKFVRRGTLLEIGAGAGYFLDEARRSGFDVAGIELNSAQVDFMRSKMQLRVEDRPLHPQSFGAEKFDVVYHCDVISHFFDPVAEFHKIHDKLRDGGFMIFETGNGGDIEDRYLSQIGTFQYPDHLFFFSDKNLTTLLETTGFKLIGTFKYSLVPQLLLRKLVANRGRKKPGLAHGSRLSAQENTPQNTERVIVGLVKKMYAWVIYFLRYKLGYMALKRGRPQTQILIARKT